MAPTQLRASSTMALRRHSVSAYPIVASTAYLGLAVGGGPYSPQRRNFWKKYYTWNSRLDPEYLEYQRRRDRRVRAAIHNDHRRRSKWQIPFDRIHLPGSRAASNWSKPTSKDSQTIVDDSKTKEAENEWESLAAEKERRWNMKVEALKQYVNANPYQAVFGKPFSPFWSPAAWRDSTKSEVLTVDTTSAKASSQETLEQGRVGMHSAQPYVEATTFSYSSKKEPGKSKVIEARSSTWDSDTNEVKRSHYDPITGRMVPVTVDNADAMKLRSTTQHESASKSPSSSKGSPSSKSPPSLKSSPSLKGSPSSKSSPSSKDFSGPSTPLDGYATNTPVDNPLPTHKSIGPSLTSSKSHDKKSSIAEKFSTLPKHDVDFLSPESIRAAMGKSCKPDKQTPQPDRAKLDSSYDTRLKQINAEIEEARQQLRESKVKSSLHTTQLRGETSLQPALKRMNMKTQQEVRPVENSTRSPPQVPFDDGYSQESIGLQNTFIQEKEAVKTRNRPSLAKEIANAGEQVPINDGYTHEPIGLQSTFIKERQAVENQERPPLADEIKQKPHEDTVSPNGGTVRPIGLQNNFAQEQQAVAGRKRPDLAQEIAEKAQELTPIDDGYTTKPVGLQSNFSDERKAVADKTRPSIAEEIVTKTNDVKVQDSFADKPMGLQSTYQKEREEVAKGVRPALAEEMQLNARVAVEAQAGLAGQHNDGYTNEPIGLQTCYERERRAHVEGQSLSLEEELKAMNSLPTGTSGSAHRSIGMRKVKKDLRVPHARSKRGSPHEATLPPSLSFLLPKADTPTATPVDVKHIKRNAAAQEMLNSEVRAVKNAMDTQRNCRIDGVAGLEEVHSELRAQVDSCKTKLIKLEDKLNQPYSSQSGSFSKELLTTLSSVEKEHQKLNAQVNFCITKLAKLQNKSSDSQARSKDSARATAGHPSSSFGARPSDNQSASPKTTLAQQEFQWAEPPLYKILAYDPNNSWSSDSMQVVSTTSRFSDNEVPISVSQALSNVSEPTRFVAHFAGLQKEGYQAIHASGNLLVLRKDILPGTSISNGAQACGTKSDRLPNEHVNPVDGTTRSGPVLTETATGNYASPTGFVNHDPVFPIEKPTDRSSTQNGQHESSAIHDGLYYRHYPRVRRQEPVFSGERADREHHRSRQKRHEKKGAWKRRVKFVFSVGATSAVLVYALGVGAELARGEKEKQQIKI